MEQVNDTAVGIPADEPVALATAAAWRRAVPGGSPPTRIDFVRPSRRKTSIYRLVGAGHDAGDVIAKRCRAATAAVERVVYEEVLPRAPEKMLAWFGHTDDEDPAYHWLFMEDAGEGSYRQDRPDHRRLAGRWLGAIHWAARQVGETGLDRRLPDRGPAHYLGLLRTARAALRPHRANPELTADDRRILALLLDDLDRLEALWSVIEERCAVMPPTLVHGDLACKNVRVRGSGADLVMLAFDWEDAGWGTPGTDLAQFVDRTVSPDLDAYLATRARLRARVDRNAVRGVAECGRFFRTLDAIFWAPLPVSHSYRYLSKPMSELRLYQQRLRVALEALESRA